MPIYTCPRCGGKDGYTKWIHELRADGFSRAPTGPKTQKFRNVDIVITACKSCGEEMEEEYTPAEIEEENRILVEQKIEYFKVLKRVARIFGYILISLGIYVFIVTGVPIISDDRTDFILPWMFWTLAFGISGVFLTRKNRKTYVGVWIVSTGKKTDEYRLLLGEFAKNEKRLNTMMGYIETGMPFNTTGSIKPEEAIQFGARLNNLGAKVLIG